MSLKQTLDQMKQDFVAKADPEILEIMKTATGNLLNSGILDQTLKTGSQAPDFTLEDAAGKSYSSEKLRKKGPLLLVFYRGVW